MKSCPTCDIESTTGTDDTGRRAVSIIDYYVREVYGKTLEYVPNVSDRNLISAITRQVTITPQIRSAIEDLSRGYVQFRQVIKPKPTQ